MADRDNSLWSETLLEYLKQYHDVTVMEDDMSALAEAVYSSEIVYAVLIPEDFLNACILGEETVGTLTESGSQWEYYVNGRIDSFVNTARVLLAGGYSSEEAAQHVLETAEVQPQVKLESTREDAAVYNVFRFMPYLYFSILCFTLGLIQKEYQNTDIRKRLLASSLSLKSQNI